MIKIYIYIYIYIHIYIYIYSRDIALWQHFGECKKCTKTLHHHFSSMCEDLRGVERCCDSHHKPVGVDSHGSPTRCSNASTSINKSIARHFFSRRTEITVGLVGLLRTAFRGQGMSEKLKTDGSLFSWNVGRGHWAESCGHRRRTSATRCASHRTLKYSRAAQHMAIVARIRTDWLR